LTANEIDSPAPVPSATDTPPVADTVNETVSAETALLPETAPPVDPACSVAGRLGGKRVHTLALLGREDEKEHGLIAPPLRGVPRQLVRQPQAQRLVTFAPRELTSLPVVAA
jgi:hypothetical protein